MIGDVVGQAKQNLGGAVAAGTEDTVGYLLSLALSPMGLGLIFCAVVVALWQARS